MIRNVHRTSARSQPRPDSSWDVAYHPLDSADWPRQKRRKADSLSLDLSVPGRGSVWRYVQVRAQGQ